MYGRGRGTRGTITLGVLYRVSVDLSTADSVKAYRWEEVRDTGEEEVPSYG